jgi:hypothetical protein
MRLYICHIMKLNYGAKVRKFTVDTRSLHFVYIKIKIHNLVTKLVKIIGFRYLAVFEK